MIETTLEYQKAQAESVILEARLKSLQALPDDQNKGFTKAGVHKLISRLHEELTVYEGGQQLRLPTSSRFHRICTTTIIRIVFGCSSRAE